jgi:hypothetical protein
MRWLLRPLGSVEGDEALNVWEHIRWAEYLDEFWSPEQEFEDQEQELELVWHQWWYADEATGLADPGAW